MSAIHAVVEELARSEGVGDALESAVDRARALPAHERTELTRALLERAGAERSYPRSRRLAAIAAELLDSGLEVDDDRLAAIARASIGLVAAARRADPPGSGLVPIDPLLGLARRYRKHAAGEAPLLDAALRELAAALASPRATTAHEDAQAKQIARALGDPSWSSPGDAVMETLAASIAHAPEPERHAWHALLSHGYELPPKVPRKWIAALPRLVAGAGPESVIAVTAAIAARLGRASPPPGGPLEPGHLVSEQATEALRTLAYAVAATGDPRAPGLLGDLAVRCQTKVPGVGPLSVLVGNECARALGEIASSAARAPAAPPPGAPAPRTDADELRAKAVTQLGAIEKKVRYVVGKRVAGRAVDDAGERAGLERGELEEVAVPTFGLDARGEVRLAIGDSTAVLRVEGGARAAISWLDAKGKPRKTAPAAAKEDGAAALAGLRKLAKEVTAALSVQRWRLERLPLEGRSWPLAVFRERYLDHPLTGPLARRLVWAAGAGGAAGDDLAPVLFDGAVARGADGAAVALDDGARVAPWHAADSTPGEREALQALLAARGIAQPWKQAHRETYVPAADELGDDGRTERFAGHIMRQGPLAELCRARGWRYRLQIEGVDSANDPTLTLEDHGIEVVLEVRSVPALERGGLDVVAGPVLFRRLGPATGRGAPRWRAERRPISLADVPPRILSEALRDADLFTSVAGISRDAAYYERLRAEEGRLRAEWGAGAYDARLAWWEKLSRAPLDAAGLARRDVLAALLPKLAIGGRCEIREPFLEVRGDRHTYAIHLERGLVFVGPDRRFMCIVPVRGEDEPGPALPFEGDAMLSEILSKAFLLADDARITEESILRKYPVR